eukprot:m.1406715 g.1406715  ORF g.1406715 m.1406715 type:complete len:163 (-) comp25014_c0_seq14:754-1242(-)
MHTRPRRNSHHPRLRIRTKWLCITGNQKMPHGGCFQSEHVHRVANDYVVVACEQVYALNTVCNAPMLCQWAKPLFFCVIHFQILAPESVDDFVLWRRPCADKDMLSYYCCELTVISTSLLLESSGGKHLRCHTRCMGDSNCYENPVTQSGNSREVGGLSCDM